MDEPDAIELSDIKGEIEFKDVWFAYNPGEWVLKGVSFHVYPKQTVAFVGSTGSGKSTILSLICRNYDIQKGQILIDGIDIKHIKISSLRRHFGQMLQDVFLFAGDIRSNIVLRSDNVSDEEVWQACRYVNADGFIKKLDQFTLTKCLDVVGWDNYPWPNDPPYFVAMKHDIMRGLKGGQSFVLTEQSPNQQNWQPYNKLKRPGEVRMLSYQAMAHGADTCLFFQMRQSIAGQEKFHGAIISHAGHEHTRVFREAEVLGHELATIGDAFLEGRTPARVAMLMDWNSWWALELTSGPSKDMDYLKTFSRYYHAFHRRNIPVDIVNPSDRELTGYDLVVAPMLYMTKEGVGEKITEFVRQGGTLVTTVMSGLVDENDRCIFGEYPGKLRDVLGIWVEEVDALRPDERNRILMNGTMPGMADSYECSFLCDLLHTRSAEALATYESDFYAGMPVITRNRFGMGKAYYIGTEPSDDFLNDFMGRICEDIGLTAPFAAAENVEVTRRVNGKGTTIFVLNHSHEPAWVDFGASRLTRLTTGESLTGKVTVAPRDVLVLRLEG